MSSCSEYLILSLCVPLAFSLASTYTLKKRFSSTSSQILIYCGSAALPSPKFRDGEHNIDLRSHSLSHSNYLCDGKVLHSESVRLLEFLGKGLTLYHCRWQDVTSTPFYFSERKAYLKGGKVKRVQR